MELKCPKCGSSEVISDVPVVSSVDTLSAVPVSVLVNRNPNAVLFKSPIAFGLTGRVCGSCGFIELYVKDPQGLAAAVRRTEIE